MSNQDNIKKDDVEQSAPAVVGEIKVSNDLLDFSSLKPKKAKKECEGACSNDKELTPRQKAILERQNKQ
ncbi:hypothetical protein [Mycoplasma phocoenae]|uniref:Uncharacterized protein n=1 Tax=Mycoplasma phocoenae TaxID=754517 RepID=A0A858U499_9MOLU|nr:hypothetical protein [Mycoplasma phocoenae]QJG66851.1 hypothetical protein HGG69_00710 [Mycoplasma phocoenae]